MRFGKLAMVLASAIAAILPAVLSGPAQAAQITAAGAAPATNSQCSDISFVYAYCIWSGTGYTGHRWLANANWPFMGSAKDAAASVGHPSSGVLRLYRDSNFYGAWVCIPAGRWIYNLANYKFNNGPHRAGYGAPVRYNVRSISLSLNGKCTKPIHGS